MGIGKQYGLTCFVKNKLKRYFSEVVALLFNFHFFDLWAKELPKSQG